MIFSTAIFSHKISLVKVVVVVTIKVWFFWSSKDIIYTLVLQFLLKAMPTLALCMLTSVVNY